MMKNGPNGFSDLLTFKSLLHIYFHINKKHYAFTLYYSWPSNHCDTVEMGICFRTSKDSSTSQQFV